MTKTQKTALFSIHQEHNGRFVDFAGYRLPLSYGSIIQEHMMTRRSAGLFDISHMGIFDLEGDSRHIFRHLEKLSPSNIIPLQKDSICYTVFLNEEGGIIDDVMITHISSRCVRVVSNGARRKEVLALLKKEKTIKIVVHRDTVLLALQGPKAQNILDKVIKPRRNIPWMGCQIVNVMGESFLLSRCGYTGGDGFEIALPHHLACSFVAQLLKKGSDAIALCGLGARDSLRLEAGLCLYGQDIDTTTTPIEASLGWLVSRKRCYKKDFQGSHRILSQIENGVERKRVGLLCKEKKDIVRSGTNLVHMSTGAFIGKVTSGGYSPCLKHAIAMGYLPVRTPHETLCHVRGKRIIMTRTSLPFLTFPRN